MELYIVKRLDNDDILSVFDSNEKAQEFINEFSRLRKIRWTYTDPESRYRPSYLSITPDGYEIVTKILNEEADPDEDYF